MHSKLEKALPVTAAISGASLLSGVGLTIYNFVSSVAEFEAETAQQEQNTSIANYLMIGGIIGLTVAAAGYAYKHSDKITNCFSTLFEKVRGNEYSSIDSDSHSPA